MTFANKLFFSNQTLIYGHLIFIIKYNKMIIIKYNNYVNLIIDIDKRIHPKQEDYIHVTTVDLQRNIFLYDLTITFYKRICFNI